MSTRILAALAVLVSAYVHLSEWHGGMRYVHVIGSLFLVNIGAGVVIAVALLAWKHWIPPFLALGFGATTLGGFAIATTPGGLFGDHEKWQGGQIWLAAIAEAVAVVAGLLALSRELRTAPQAAGRTVVG